MAQIQYDENISDHGSPLTDTAPKDVAEVLSVLTLGRRSDRGDFDYQVAPVHRMVPEILLEIFSYCLPPLIDGISSMFSLLPSPLNFSPWIISHVCAGWRKVMFASPSCWTNVWIIFRGNQYTLNRPASNKMWKSAVNLISWQIILAYKQPLRLFFDAGDISQEQISAISDLILANQKKWEMIAFRSTAKSPTKDLQAFEKLFGVRGSNFCILKKLHIHVTDPKGFIVAASHPGYGWQFPALEHVRMYGGLVGVFPRLDTLPWSNLTFLSLTFVRLGDVHSILPYLKKLRKLEVLDYVSVNGVGPAPKSLPVTLPHLKALYICDRARFGLVNAITTPSLRHLKCFRRLPNNAATDIFSILALIRRSACFITDYTGSIYTSNSGGLLPILLSVLPALTTLKVRMRDFDLNVTPRVAAAHIPDPARISDLMEVLGAKNADGSFTACPLLASITVLSDDWYKISHIEVVSLVDVCESRFDGGSGHLRSVVFPMHATDWSEPLASQQMQRLIDLYSAGLHVEISNWDGRDWDFVGQRWVRNPTAKRYNF